jgi:hypothetical protein
MWIMSRRPPASRAISRALVASCAVVLCGCAMVQHAEEKVLGAYPAPDAGFLEAPARLQADPERAPFARIWTSRAHDWRRLPKLYVAPVDTGHVLEESLWQRINIRQWQVQDDVADVAAELRASLMTAFREDPQHHFQVVERPDEIDGDTAILELGLVELVPNKVVLGVIGLAAWGAPLEIGIPVATATAFIAHGSIAMEARVRDAGSGRVVAMFADRETGALRIIDLRSLTWYGNAHEVIRDWAKAFVELANSPSPQRAKPSPLFSFVPW